MQNTAKHRGTDSAKVVQVIRTVALKGAGTDDDPCRLIAQYWTLNGRLICEEDISEIRDDCYLPFESSS